MASREGKGGDGGLLEDHSLLQAFLLRVLHERFDNALLPGLENHKRSALSSVLFLLGMMRAPGRPSPELCVVLNKRSENVRQPGDLCCPGGGVEYRLDRFLGKLLYLPGSPLARWPFWSGLRRERPLEARTLAMLFAAGLRESWEEMRLNPFGIRFLGPLPPQRLQLFDRIIYPVAGWVLRQDSFTPGWEVEKIVSIPVRHLLDPSRYARYRLHIVPHLEKVPNRTSRDLPCFSHAQDGRRELLWGATYGIVTLFLKIAFGFTPPDVSGLPEIAGVLDESYLHAAGKKPVS